MHGKRAERTNLAELFSLDQRLSTSFDRGLCSQEANECLKDLELDLDTLWQHLLESVEDLPDKRLSQYQREVQLRAREGK